MTLKAGNRRHSPTSGMGTTANRTRPGQVEHDLLVRVEPLRCGVCDQPSDRAVCRKCEPLVTP